MTGMKGTPRGAVVAIDDMLDYCAQIKPGQEVLILAQIDGLYGGINLVDEEAVGWIQSAVQHRGANPTIMWIDEPATLHKWRIPPVVKAALKGCDVLINHSFDLIVEEMLEFRGMVNDEGGFIMVRNFATTAPLLCTEWAQTPHELVSEIRYQASVPFKAGLRWVLTDENGSHLEGVVRPSSNPAFPAYTTRRHEVGGYRPWPEWVFPPIDISDTSGIFVFDRMLSWWPRYIGVDPYFKRPIRLTIENCRITGIDGGEEADALSRFLRVMSERLGEGVYNFNGIHCGVHPHAKVEPHVCPDPNYRRLIEHCGSSNVHVHIGAPPPAPDYNYWFHCTGDTLTATWRVGDTLVLDRGHMTALDYPEVRAVASRYPGRPGV
jgi:hypothetical protein